MSRSYLVRQHIISAHELDAYEEAEEQMAAKHMPIVVDWMLIEDDGEIAHPEAPDILLTITTDGEPTFNQFMARVGIAAVAHQGAGRTEE